MRQPEYDIVTLKPHWSVKDLFISRGEAENKQRILHELDGRYLSKGWTLADDIMWGARCEYAVVKIGRDPQI